MNNAEIEERYLREDRQSMTEPARQWLDRWLADMDDRLDSWKVRYLPEGFRYDFSMESLDLLEEVILRRYQDESDFEADSGSEFLEGAVRYYGETLRKRLSCRWGYQDMGPDVSNPFNRVPQIRSNTRDEYMDVIVPLHVFDYLVAERQPGVLQKMSGVITRALHNAELDVDNLG
ncbi:hypothetical protein [Streptomyces broussonetiae]|uniref:hypothetical protein n=1 Tax=Streptomyces broussonetiae TaxID=2686304 RepID=UPI0035D67FCD